MSNDSIDPSVRAYLASLGRIGGRAKGACKRRTPEHYQAMVKVRLQKKVMKGLEQTGIIEREMPKKGE